MDTHALRSPRPQGRTRIATTGVVAAYGIAVLVLATMFGSLDRQIMILLAEPMRHSLGLSDTKLGLLQGVGITLFAGITALPLGWLADRFGRRSMLAGCVLVWTAATAFTGMAQSFEELFIAAVGLGIGEAGLIPIVYGLIPEIVSARRRVLANSIYALAAILGAGVGTALSGALVGALENVRPLLPQAWQALETWRLAFFGVALPGPLVALCILMIRLHPQRGSVAGPAFSSVADLGAYARTHAGTMARVFGGSGLAALGIGAAGNWAPVVASRSFGASPAEVGEGIGAAYLIGTAGGALIGSVAVKALRRRLGMATPIRVISVGSVLAALASLLMPLVHSATGLYLLFGVQVATLIAASMLAPTLLQDMSPEALRSRVIAIGTAVSVGLSSSSPVLVGVLSDLLHAHPDGLTLAMAGVGALAFALAALVMRAAETPFVNTVREIHREPTVDLH